MGVRGERPGQKRRREGERTNKASVNAMRALTVIETRRTGLQGRFTQSLCCSVGSPGEMGMGGAAGLGYDDRRGVFQGPIKPMAQNGQGKSGLSKGDSRSTRACRGWLLSSSQCSLESAGHRGERDPMPLAMVERWAFLRSGWLSCRRNGIR